ncbi:MAG: ABC transporter substrate-binding protein [Alphaproteobacteria bacterium]
MFLSRVFILFVFSCSFCIQNTESSERGEHKIIKFVQKVVDECKSKASKNNTNSSSFKLILEKYLDISKISSFVLGPVIREMTDKQKKRFNDLYKERLLDIYTTPEALNILKETEQIGALTKKEGKPGKSALIHGHFKTSDDKSIEVVFQVITGEENLSIVDIQFEGISTLISENKAMKDLYSKCSPDKKCRTSQQKIEYFLNALSKGVNAKQ